MMISMMNTSNSIWGAYNLASQLKANFKSMEKLASGLAINWASDDPAGLVISEQLRTQSASLGQQIENVSNTIQKYQTASSTVGSLRSQLTELRSLAIGASNEALNSEAAQQAYVDAAESITSTYNQVAQNAEYNGSPLFDGSEGSVASISDLTGLDLSSAESAAISIERIDQAIQEIDQIQVDLGATQKNELESELRSLQVTRQNLVASESTIRDTDYATEYSKYISSMITAQATMSMMSHNFEMSRSLLTLFGNGSR